MGIIVLVFFIKRVFFWLIKYKVFLERSSLEIGFEGSYIKVF